MAKQSRKQLLQRYQARIKNAERWRRDDEDLDGTWQRMIDLYRGKHFPAEYSGREMIVVAIAKATVDVIVPSVSVNHPKITITPTNEQNLLGSAITEQVANYQWRHWNFKKPCSTAIKDSLIMGIGWAKIGWRYREGEQPMTAEEIAQEQAQLEAQLNLQAAQDPAMAADLPTPEDIQATMATTKTVVLEDRPFVERVSPFDVYVDPNATSMDDVAWIAQRIVRPLEEAKKDERYAPSARSKLQADGVFLADKAKSDLNAKDPHRGMDVELTTIWEFYDVRKNWLCVFGQDCDEFLVAPEPMPYAFGQPFEPLMNYTVPDKFYPMGELEPIEPLQQELDKVRSQMMEARKKFGRKYIFRESSFGPEGLSALQSDADNVMVAVIEDQTPLDQVIQPVPQGQLDPQAYQYSDIIEMDMDRVTGINEYMRGSMPENTRTATEASIIQDAANARAAAKLAEVEDFISRIARKLIMLNQQFLEGDQVMRIAGPNGAMAWVQYTRDDIQGEYDYEVEAGSTQPKNDTARAQQAVAAFSTFAPLMGTVIDPVGFTAWAMREMGIKQPEQFLNPMGGMAYMMSQQPQQAQNAETGKNAPQPNQKGGESVTPPSNSQGQQIPPELMAALQAQQGMDMNSQMPTNQPGGYA
jgi:hypothetical protein